MKNSEKAKFGEDYVANYLIEQGYTVRKRKKGELGFDLIAEKDGMSIKVEVKTSNNLRGGIPDMHDTEFSRVGENWIFNADFLYVLRLKGDLPRQIDILSKAEIDLYSQNHKTITRIRTMRLDRDLFKAKVGKTVMLLDSVAGDMEALEAKKD